MKRRSGNTVKTKARLRRRGVATLESELILLALLTFLFGMLDVGLAVMRYNALNTAARRAARW